MSNRLRVQRRTATSVPAIHEDSRLDAKEVQPPTPPASAPTLAHDFATLDIASQDQLAALADPEVQRTHLRIQPREPRFQWGTERSVQRSTEDLGQRIRAAQAGGSPLEPVVQQQLESGLGADLSGVRTHTDGEANQLSQAVSATAFTTGSHIFFQSGAYRPHSGEGMRVLAHEAAHTVQQARGPVDGTPAPGGVSISDPSDRFEQTAETAAQRVVSGRGESRDVEEAAGGHAASESLQLQRWPDFLKVSKKPPPPPSPAPGTPEPASGNGAGSGGLFQRLLDFLKFWKTAPPKQESLPELEEAPPPELAVEQAAPAAPVSVPEPEGPARQPSGEFAPQPEGPARQPSGEFAPQPEGPARQPSGDGSVAFAPVAFAPNEASAPEPARPAVEFREPRAAKLPPGVAEQAKYKTKALIPKYREEGERLAPEKWVGGKYVGQAGELYKHQPLAVKYLAEEERAGYEIRLNKDQNLFYWEKTGEVFDTMKMTSVGGQSKAKERAIFVMTESGKIYAANEGAETRTGVRTPEQEARWRFNHSSFLWGEPVAAAGELIFDKGTLVGVTDMSGHYYPEVDNLRQVVQEFVAQGVNVSGVWVLLSAKGGGQGEWYVTAEDLIRHSDKNEAQFRSMGIGSPQKP